jgi:two-component system, chemotaxis family, sensor kinase CheA
VFIDDDELRSLFKAESTEHLLRLDRLLRRLEEKPGDEAALADSLRVAHSLKGAARMVGVAGAEAVAHRLEDLLGAVRRGETTMTGSLVDRCFRALDAVHGFVREAVSGKAARISVADVLAALESDAGEPDDAIDDTVFQVETIRVDPHRLDRLMTEAGELVVARTRVLGRLGELSQLVDDAERGGASVALRQRLGRLHDEMTDDVAQLEGVTARLEEGVSAIRLMPFSAVFDLFPRMVRDIARDRHRQARLEIQGSMVTADKRIVEELKDPLMHLMRNSIDHGIEPPDERVAAGKRPEAVLRVRAIQDGDHIIVSVSDDGRGLNPAAIRGTAVARGLIEAADAGAMSDADVHRLIFVQGFSTAAAVTELSGRGVGLDVVKRTVERLEGTVSVDSTPGRGSTFTLRLPVTLAATRVLVVAAAGELYALPLSSVVTTVRVEVGDVVTTNGEEFVQFDGRPVPLATLARILERPTSMIGHAPWTCVVVADGTNMAALRVTTLVDERELIVKPNGGLLKRVRNVFGATILPSGAVCHVLNASDLLKSLHAHREAARTSVPRPTPKPASACVVLLAEDSITTRIWEQRLLESAGYEVVTAVDGQDALDKFGTRAFDAVVTDVQMPNLDGLGLVEAIRRDERHRSLPIVLVTSLDSEEDRRRGLEAGADAYLVKSTVDRQQLVDTLKRLIG